MVNEEKSQSLLARCRALIQDQKGAMAVMSLAAFLVLVMVGMTLYDVSEIGVEKTHLQTATDTAAYSQATVEARAMNLIAFNNVGKRMTVGMVNTYINLNQWLLNLTHIATYLSIICGVASVFAPPLAPFCQQLAQAAGGAAQLESGESSVRGGIYSKGNKKCWMECFSCSWSGCGWSCCQRYLDIHEWAAPVSDTQWATGMLPAIPCGKVVPPVGPKFGPIKCGQPDIWTWNSGSLVNNYFGRDLLAMDNYQRYMASLAPYWAWTEGTVRGMANAAPVTVSYPMPDFGENQAHVAQVPVVRGSWNDTCQRATDQDRGLDSPLALDIALKNLISGFTGGGSMGGGMSTVGKIGAITIAGLAAMTIDDLDSGNILTEMLPRGWNFSCKDPASEVFQAASGGGGPFGGFGFGGGGDYVPSFRQYGRPFLLHNYQGHEAQWLMDSSTLTFGFRPNANRFGDGRENKFFVAGDHDYWGPDAGGVWAMSRAEMSYQGSGGPTAWSPAWTARMRPVALPGEWDSYENDFSIADAFDEIGPSMSNPIGGPIGQATVAAHMFNTNGDLITHPHGNVGGELLEEVIAIQAAMQGLNNERLEGVSR